MPTTTVNVLLLVGGVVALAWLAVWSVSLVRAFKALHTVTELAHDLNEDLQVAEAALEKLAKEVMALKASSRPRPAPATTELPAVARRPLVWEDATYGRHAR